MYTKPSHTNVDRHTSNSSNRGNPVENGLLSVVKPAQYLGGELNSVLKADKDVSLHMALCFPDTYEVGMSHIGLQILYSIANKHPLTWAERVFMPMADMEQLMVSESALLKSLEGKRPLKEFDLVGFSLQYELCGTNIVAMLELGGIPAWAADRSDGVPLIIGGGPYSYHPEAIAPFFDAFLLGDAEEALPEIIEATLKWKHESHEDTPSRQELLKLLSQIKGIYVPSFYAPNYDEQGHLNSIENDPTVPPVVVRRLLETLEGAPYAEKPVVPNIKTVHNRLSIEVMRGCVRGCRFCQAGYLYRPQRERPPEEIIEMVAATLPKTGFEELSLLSLSTADYCSIVPLLQSLMDNYSEGQLAISFPSTRVDSLKREVLEQVQRVRRTNFTVAPEAGTQRLRDVINKGVSDDEILTCAKNVFELGWTGIKLYFMIGLPTETDEDLQGIIDVARRIRALPEARGKSITVSCSTHVPKPHTPFQWAEQISPAETIRRQRLLAQGLRKIPVNFRYHDAFSSFLEGVFCRGDRKLTPAIYRAYELGARLDAWADKLNQELWLQAFLDTDINPYYYLRQRELDEVLPWDHLSASIPKQYFAKEWARATRAKETPDCLTQSCSICGACDYQATRNILWPREDSEDPNRSAPATSIESGPAQPVSRVRLRFSKDGVQSYLGHLELINVFHRAARRAGIPLAYSQGFHPLPRLVFGPPLQLGIPSDAEYVDAFLSARIEPDLVREFFNQTLPQGLRVEDAAEIDFSKKSSLAAEVDYLVFSFAGVGPFGGRLAELVASGIKHHSKNEDRIDPLLFLDIEVLRKGTKSKPRQGNNAAPTTFTLGEHIKNLEVVLDSANQQINGRFWLKVDPSRPSPRATEIVEALIGLSIVECDLRKTNTVFKQPSVGVLFKAPILNSRFGTLDTITPP